MKAVIKDGTPFINFGENGLSVKILEFIRFRLVRYLYPDQYSRRERNTEFYGDLANSIKTSIDKEFPVQGNQLGRSLAPYLDLISQQDIEQGRAPLSVFCSLKQGSMAGYPSSGFYEMLEKMGFRRASHLSEDNKKALVDFLRTLARNQVTSLTSKCVFTPDGDETK